MAQANNATEYPAPQPDNDEIEQLRNQVHNLTIALRSSRRIGAAIGILMATRKVTEQTAFTMLVDRSQRTNRKVRDIAEEVLQTGALP